MSLNGSYGLMVDLGTAPAPEKLEKLYHRLWAEPHLSGPDQTFAEFGKIPRGAQGHLNLPSGQKVAAYTRFERDNLGYPPEWTAPVLLSLGLSELEPDLPNHPEAQQSLAQCLHTLQSILTPRLAVLGHSNLYHVNAELLGPEWLDFQQDLLLGLWLPATHPLIRKLGLSPKTDWVALTPQDWATCLSADPEDVRYQRYKATFNQRKTEPKIQIEWEQA